MPSGDAERLRDVATATDASSDATSTYQAAPAVAALSRRLKAQPRSEDERVSGDREVGRQLSGGSETAATIALRSRGEDQFQNPFKEPSGCTSGGPSVLLNEGHTIVRTPSCSGPHTAARSREEAGNANAEPG
jgi:hypothetical protein